MKYVQIGILACLASITILLGAIYWEQQTPEVADTHTEPPARRRS